MSGTPVPWMDILRNYKKVKDDIRKVDESWPFRYITTSWLFRCLNNLKRSLNLWFSHWNITTYIAKPFGGIKDRERDWSINEKIVGGHLRIVYHIGYASPVQYILINTNTSYFSFSISKTNSGILFSTNSSSYLVF